MRFFGHKFELSGLLHAGLLPTLQRWPGASPLFGTASPVESEGGCSPSTLSTGQQQRKRSCDPPCSDFDKSADLNRFDELGSHMWSTIFDSSQPRGRVEIRIGVGRRRRWSNEEKGRIVAESYASGAIVSEIARRHEISPQHFFLAQGGTGGTAALPVDADSMFVPIVTAMPDMGMAARITNAWACVGWRCTARREGLDMITVAADTPVLIATKPVDFLKGADGLVAVVRETLSHDPFSGAIYVFRSKRRPCEDVGLGRLRTGAFVEAACVRRVQVAPITEGAMRLTSYSPLCFYLRLPRSLVNLPLSNCSSPTLSTTRQ
jgi:Transposase/IS66 Orf2 like protein